MLQRVALPGAAQKVGSAAGPEDENRVADHLARLPEPVRRPGASEVPIDVVVERMDRERERASAGQPIDAVPAGEVLDVVAEVVRQGRREAPRRLLALFADRRG